MSLFNRLTYYALLLEIGVYLLTLIPLGFIPVATKKNLMLQSKKIFRFEWIQWILRIALFMIATVFLDTIMRLRKMESPEENPKDSHGHSELGGVADLQRKVKYLSMFTLLMTLVLYVRLKDVFCHLENEEVLQAKNLEIEALKSGKPKESVKGMDLKEAAKKKDGDIELKPLEKKKDK